MFNKKSLRRAVLFAPICLLMVMSFTAFANNDDVIIQAPLTGAAISGIKPSGVAEFRQRAGGGSSFKVEVENVNLPAGTVLNVLVNSTKIGVLTLTSTHTGEFELNTNDGQTVPAIANGTTVNVTNSAGTTIVLGTFSSASPSPTPTPNPSPTPSPSPASEVRLRIGLTGALIGNVAPKGTAEFRRRTDGGRSFKVEVEEVNLPAGTSLNVLVDGVKIGSLVLDALREGELELSTNDGQQIPPIVNGTTVVVTNATGTTIVAGVFDATLAPPGPTPTPTPTPTPAPNAEIRIRAPLTGATLNNATPKGVAEFRQPADGSRRLKVEVEDVNLPAGTTLNVLLDNAKIGTVVINQFFKGELELNTKDGQSVPAVISGTAVTVTTNTGDTIAAGTFGANNTTTSNALEDSSFFVRQHYIDFLGRGPETGGFDSWLGVLNRCGNVNNDPSCDRIEVSAAFFRSPEFQLKGFFVYRFYAVSLGRLPHYNEFVTDMQSVTGLTPEEVAQKKDAFTNAWGERAEFKAIYDSATDARSYVDKLLATAGVTLNGAVTRETLIADLQAGRKSRADVLRAIVEHPEVEAKEYNSAFVAMQYFGYLRRDPESDGYNAWLRVINRGDSYRVMINGFMNSIEYRGRFGQP